jgi:regulator of sirC expression with transglutaminase-like and TPR domain
MSNHGPARQLFRQLIRQPEARLPLAELVLCVGWEDQGGGDPRLTIDALDGLAAGASARMEGLSEPRALIAALNSYLFSELGFHGNPHCYDRPDPADSFLDRVVERRTGLPILLSLVYLEVGWRLGLPVAGMGLPGHFMVSYHGPGEPIYIDPYDGGRLWSRAECMRQIAAFHSAATPAERALLMAPSGRRAILERILRNLKHTYLARHEFRPALAASDRLLLLCPADVGELRDHGLLRFRLGQTMAALEDLERYAARAPQARDLYDLRAFAHMLVDKFAPLN